MKTNKINLIFLFIIGSFVTIGLRLFFIQVWHHQELQSRVQRTMYKNRPETSCRGRILDRNGKVLSVSVKSYDLFIDENSVEDMGAVRNQLKQMNIVVPPAGQKPRSYVQIKENVDLATVKVIKSWNIRGIGFTSTYRRKYPEENLACHVIGVLSKEGKGLEGVEYAMDSYLSAKHTKELKYRDGRGREIAEKVTDLDELKGADVYLTIDRNLQYIAEQEAEKAWRKSKSKNVIIIIQDPNNAEILALACRPNFNPENFSDAGDILKNKAISDAIEPGSTFKLITAAAALEEKMVKRKEVIWCENGKFKVYNHIIKDHEKEGLITFDEVIERSSNIGTAKVGLRLGKEMLYTYIRQFGFYSKTGIELPGEARGLLEDPARWSGLSVPSISFGQEIGVTPLQIINAYTSIANDGFLYKPSIVNCVKDPGGKMLYEGKPTLIRKSISEKTAANLKEILVGVVENGTGKLAKVDGYTIGGKTGTAQKRDKITKKYSSSMYVSSFCGIVPVKDPRLTILVIVDEPKDDYWASTVAVPVFQGVASRSLQYLRIPPEEKTLYIAEGRQR